MKLSWLQTSIFKYADALKRHRLSGVEGCSSFRVCLHIQRSSEIVRMAVLIHMLCFATFSRVLFWKRPGALDQKQADIIFRILTKEPFLAPKVRNLFSVIISLHVFGGERLRVDQKTSRTLNRHCKEYPFLVIGSGPGGAVTAQRLNKAFKGQVALLEAGEAWSMPDSKHPGDEFLHKWKYGGITTTLPPTMLSIASGACLGGGSEINSGLMHEPDEVFFKNWQQNYKVEGINEKHLKILLSEIRSLTERKSRSREDVFDRAMWEGATKQRLALASLPKFARLNHEPAKNTMSSTYLKSFQENGGSIYTKHTVQKIEKQDDYWTVTVCQRNRTVRFKCRFLFVCCGAIYSNQLLLRSGIARQKSRTLRKFNVHPMAKAIGLYPYPLQELNQDVSQLQVMEYYPNYIIGNAASSRQFLEMPFTEHPEVMQSIKAYWQRMKMFHVTFCLGQGTILDTGRAILSYKFNSDEKELIGEGFQKMIDFVKATGAVSVLPVTSDKKIQSFKGRGHQKIASKVRVNKIQLSAVHVFGGVTSGEHTDCVADSYGRVVGHRNLFVNDSSLINNKLLKNPQGTVMLIALRNVENFIRNYRNL